MDFQKFLGKDTRTIKARKNIFESILLRGIDSIVYLLLVPVTLGYLNPYEYGIWLTLNSILTWINSLDIGLGNGMRNKLAEAIAIDDRRLARHYVSTTFFMLILIMGSLIGIGTLLFPYIDWYSILSTTSFQVPHLKEIVYVSFIIFCINLIFKFVGNIYLAFQLPAINNLMITSGHILSLITIYVLTKATASNLLFVAIAYSMSPLIVYLVAYPITFQKIYPYLSPSYRYFDRRYLKVLFNIGIQFFLLQLGGILLFAFANLLISHIFGPEQVTPYNISYRYFSLCMMGMSIILSPFWSATTDAYVKNDIIWIRKAIKNIHKVLCILMIVILIMICISNSVYRLWIGKEIEIPMTVSGLMGVYTCILIWSLSYSNFLYGIGKLRIQTINTVCVAILFYPVCRYLGIKLGICGVLVGMCFLNSTGLILNVIQFNKLINNRAVGLWNK